MTSDERLAYHDPADPIRKQMTRAVRWYCHPRALCVYLALYGTNSATPERRQAFVGCVMARF